MTALAIILAILLILLTGFLLAPVSLYIDTEQGCYEVFQTPVFRFFVVIKNGTIVPRLQLAGINVPLQSKKKTKPVKKTDKKHKKKSAFKKSVSAWRFLIERSLRSFDIKQAVVDLDTDNVVLNAQLVPVFFWASHGPVQLNTNFNGRVYFHLEARNRPARILWIFFQFLTKK
jgi:hypothetical protein